jgi:hypothetical protein
MLIDPPPDTSGRPTFRPMVQNKFSRLRSTGNGYIPCRGYAPCQVLSTRGTHLARYFLIGGSRCARYFLIRFNHRARYFLIRGTRARYFPNGGTQRARYFPIGVLAVLAAFLVGYIQYVQWPRERLVFYKSFNTLWLIEEILCHKYLWMSKNLKWRPTPGLINIRRNRYTYWYLISCIPCPGYSVLTMADSVHSLPGTFRRGV